MFGHFARSPRTSGTPAHALAPPGVGEAPPTLEAAPEEEGVALACDGLEGPAATASSPIAATHAISRIRDRRLRCSDRAGKAPSG